MSLRSWLLVGLLLGTSCDSLFGSFARPNPKNCVRSPDICSTAEFCDTVSERCVSIAPDAELFAPLSRPHEFSFDHVLSGNFDGNGVPDAVLVGPGRALVLYNPGTSLATQKVFTTNTTKQPFFALATRVDSDTLDDLVIVTERGNSSSTYGTIEFCAARGSDSLQPFACLPPQGLQFIPKAFLISDLIDDSTPELAAIDAGGAIQVCRVLSVSGMQGACEELANPEPMLYGQMALLDDVNGDGRRDIGLLMHPVATGPKLRVLRSNAGANPTLSDPTAVSLQSPELVAGNFNHSGKISLVAIGGAGGGTIVAQPFYDLSGTAPVASAMVEAQAGSLVGDPSQGRATAVGQFDGVGGSTPDDIAALLSNGQLALFVGSPAGIKTQILPGSFTPLFGSHLLAAPFTPHVGGRYDLLVYGDPQKARVDLMAFLRNTGSSPRGLFTRSSLTNTGNTTSTTPDYLVLSGRFSSSSARELALLPHGGNTLTVMAHDGTGIAPSPASGSPLNLPDIVDSATVLPCGDAPDAIAIAFHTEKRPAIYRQGAGGLTPQMLESSVNLLQTLAADLNGDGLSDLVVLRSDGKVQAALAQSRTCTLAPLTDLIPPTIPLPLQIAVGDLNADGSSDLVVLGDGGGVRVFRNQVDGAGKAKGVFELVAETNLPIELSPGQMAIGEPRRKGSPELLINMKPPAGNSQLYALALAADGRSLTTTKLTVDTLVQGSTLLLRDLNQDGLAEALMLEPEKGILSVSSWAQQSGGRTRSFYLGVTASGLSTGLVDADVLPDVAVVTKMEPMQTTTVGLSVSYGLSGSDLQ